jgi:transcriptional regulator with XRE-family HTH domain
VTREGRGEPDLPPGPARDLVDLFRRLRQARKLSGGQLAVKTGLSPSYISDVLRGWRAPGPDAAMKVASALGGSLEEVTWASRLAEELAELNQFNRGGEILMRPREDCAQAFP